MKIILTILLTVLFNCFAIASGINLENKAIKKSISKAYSTQQYELKPLDLLSDSKFVGQYFTITNSQSVLGFIYVGRVNSCRANGCSISAPTMETNQSEYFDYFCLYDTAGTIELVKIFNYAASYGHEVCSKNWLRQFIGYQGDSTLEVDKNVDAISGATISVYSITHDIETVTYRLIKKLKNNY